MTTVTILCISGTVKVHPSGQVLAEGESVEMGLSGAPQVTPYKVDPSRELPGNVKDAQGAPGVGCNGAAAGTASVTAKGGAVTVRQYLPVNPFLQPDAVSYDDHVLADAASVAADMVQENAQTLVVMGGA